MHHPGILMAPATVFVKSVRVDNLDAIQRTAIDFAFGLFFKDEQPNEFVKELNPARKLALEKAGIVTGQLQAPFRYRRFAGGADLPRARYFTLSDDRAGNDHGTLLCEMLTYVDHEKCGRFHARDESAGFASHGSLAVGAPGMPATITIDFLDDVDGESPFVRELVARELIQNAKTTRVEIPYRIQEVRIERTVDLRQPAVQAWLHERLSERGLPGACFEYATDVSQRLTWVDFAPTDAAQGTPMESADGLPFDGIAVTFGPCDSWDEGRFTGPDDFTGLLPYLIFGTRGGSPVTDAIGRWLRAAKVEALIYPSARNDVACEVQGGSVTHTAGWNLVDYRVSPPPIRSLFWIIQPDSWRFASAPHGADIRRYDVRLPPQWAHNAGSFWVCDQAELLLSVVAFNQRMVGAGAQMRRALSAMRAQPDIPPREPVRMDNRRLRQCLDANPALTNAPLAIDQACTFPDPAQRIAALLGIQERLHTVCRSIPDTSSDEVLHDAIAFLDWKLAFHIGSSWLFNFKTDPATRAEQAVRWLSTALETPIRELNAFEWARTQGELSTAYKNRLSGDADKNFEAALACIGRCLEVFSPQGDHRQWLITIKQRAIVRLSAQRSAEEAGVEIERAIAELEAVVDLADPDADFDLWSSACSALGAAHSTRHLGYFVQNGERSIQVLEKLLRQVGDLTAMMSQGAMFDRLNLAAGTAVNLAVSYQGRRIGDSRSNRGRALELLRPARVFFAAIQDAPTLEIIDKRIAELEAEVGRAGAHAEIPPAVA